MKEVIITMIFFILFTVNLGVLLAIGWGAFYPKYEIVIFLHILMTVFFGVGTVYTLDDL